MITERVIYEFGNVPVPAGDLTIKPYYDMVKILQSKDPNKWIQYLIRDGSRRKSLDNPNILVVVIWDTGMGSWGWIKQE